MTYHDRFDMVRQVLAARAKTEVPTPQCLDDDTIAALAAGTLDAPTRAAALPHVAGCARCRGAVASVARALSDSSVAREVAALEGAGWRRFVRIALPVAAAAALLLLAWPPSMDDEPPHRAPPVTAAPAPAPVSPVGPVADAPILRWTSVPGTDRYRVTLFGAGGQVRYETELADTVALLPDSVVLAPGRPYLWKVEARTGFDRWATSALVEFSIAQGRPR